MVLTKKTIYFPENVNKFIACPISCQGLYKIAPVNILEHDFSIFNIFVNYVSLWYIFYVFVFTVVKAK